MITWLKTLPMITWLKTLFAPKKSPPRFGVSMAFLTFCTVPPASYLFIDRANYNLWALELTQHKSLWARSAN